MTAFKLDIGKPEPKRVTFEPTPAGAQQAQEWLANTPKGRIRTVMPDIGRQITGWESEARAPRSTVAEIPQTSHNEQAGKSEG